jgi:hypothetical protein
MTYQNLKMIKKFFIFNCHFAFCILIFAFIQILVVFLISKDVFANEANNKFGIHLAQPHLEDLKKVAELVNSNGGDWGYVTLVIQENDRNSQKWQEIFDLLRKYHLIPIIRLATTPLGENWKRPNPSDAYSWASFLDSLNWVVKNRYVVLFNEPNHATEWGGAVDPKDYAKVAFAFAKTLKEKNPNFFVMLSGFDASAPHLPPKFYDEEIFLKEMLTATRELTHNDNSQKNSNQKKRRSNLDIGSDIPKVNRFHIFSSNLKLKTKKNILKIKSYVNNKKLFAPFNGEKLGVIIAAAKKPADKLIQRAEVIRKSAFFDFLESLFIKNILAQEKKDSLFDYIDGWASHSYPNPAFSGSPYDFGRGTVRTYQWELNLLRQLGVEKDLPVFITETGWERKKLSEEQVAQNFKIAFEQIWLPDEKVMAVTPFVLDYQMEPFLGFSWKSPSAKASEGQEFYQQYYVVQSLNKVKGEPEQIEKGEISFDLPKELVNKSTYQFKIKLKNQGQGYWDERNYLLLVNNVKKTEFLIGNLGEISPNEEKEVNFYLKTKDEGEEKIKFILQKNGKNILESKEWYFNILPLPSLKIKTGLFPKLNDSGFDFELQIFDEKENLVFQKKNLLVKVGEGEVANIENIVFGKRYRLVFLKPYYLPRQSYLVFKKGKNKVSFKPMLPLDFDLDGKFSLKDILELIKKPKLLKLLFP